MAKILKGADVVEALNNKMISQVKELKNKGIVPTFATLRVGEISDQISYEKAIIKRAETVGVTNRQVVLPLDVDEETVINEINALNNDSNIHGVLIFRPLPKHLNDEKIRLALNPEKDIDGITDGSLAGVFSGSDTGFAPCTAKACIEILDFYNINCTGKRAVVIGRSLVVGKPVAIMLMGKNATVTVCHTKTVDVASITKNAEIIIVAAGQMEAYNSEYFSSGQIVIDVGIHWSEEKGKLCGDVLFDDVEPIVEAITPVPGGVGTVTTSVLISNVVKAAEEHR